MFLQLNINSVELKLLNIIHLSLCLGIILFGIVTYIVVGNQAYFSTQLGNVSPYYLLMPLVGLISITIGSSIFSKGVARAKEEVSFEQKLAKFKRAFLIRCGLVEFSAILNITGFLLSGNLIFLAFGGISLLSLFSYRIIKPKLIADLQISFPDTERL